MTGFAQLGVRSPILDALATMGYETPTPVQAKALPALLAGKDALVEAQTGSGKTTAFGIPAVVVGSAARGLRSLVLVPTRELARQVADELRALGTGSPIRTVALTGGLSAEQEERALHGDVRCVVATPGRLIALLEQHRVRLDDIKLVVLDEADRMLDMGFGADVERVLAATPEARQTVLVSATIPADVRALAQRIARSPVEVRVEETVVPQSLSHFRVNVFEGQKEAALVALMKKENPDRAIVFVRTRDRSAAFTKLLKKEGFAADPLQGDMSHDQRRHVFDLFSRGVTKIMVATDLASRGLDVPEMQLVVNVDLPDEDEQYVHRAGRAARMGRPGKVVSFVLPDEKEQRLRLEREAGAEFAPYRLDIPPPAKPAPPNPAPFRRAAPPRKEKKDEKDAKIRMPRAPPKGDGSVPPSRKDRKQR